MPKTLKIEAIDFFCGIGGLSYGLKMAKIDVLAGLDNDASCAFSYKMNIESQFILADVSNFSFDELARLFSKNSVKVLVGCPPCQPFSTHTNKAKNRRLDDRWYLLNYFTKAIELLKPDIVSMENVRGIARTEIFDNFKNRMTRMSYKFNYDIVYCPNYGIPQNRSRLVFLASKLGEIKMPPITHTKDRYLSVRSTIKHLPKIESGETHTDDKLHRAKNLCPLNLTRIKQSKPNGTWRDWNEQLLPNCYRRESGQSYQSVYGRMSWDNIAPTITTEFYNYGSGRFGHPEQNRALSIREGALLQTFPMSYDFGNNINMTKTGRHIGNAVPPRLGYLIGQAIKSNVEEYYGD